MELDNKTIAAMAIAAIAEETGEDMNDLRVVSFREVKKSTLATYLAEKGISYKKYELGDELV